MFFLIYLRHRGISSGCSPARLLRTVARTCAGALALLPKHFGVSFMRDVMDTTPTEQCHSESNLLTVMSLDLWSPDSQDH